MSRSKKLMNMPTREGGKRSSIRRASMAACQALQTQRAAARPCGGRRWRTAASASSGSRCVRSFGSMVSRHAYSAPAWLQPWLICSTNVLRIKIKDQCDLLRGYLMKKLGKYQHVVFNQKAKEREGDGEPRRMKN